MIKKLIILSCLAILSQTIFAQKDYRPGFIVKNNGDTLYGEIDYRGDMIMKNTCKFRLRKSKSVTTFTPNELLSFRFDNSKYFVSRNWNGEQYFLEYLINGKVSIFYYRSGDRDHYLIEKDSIKMTEFPFEEEIVTVKGKSYFRKRTQHLNILNYYMSDAPDLIKSIKNIDAPEHQPLIKIAQQYHALVCKDRQCIIYEKKIPFFKVNPEVVGGVFKIHHKYEDLDLKLNYYGVGGILANIWMPRSNENFYFRTGVIFLSAKSADRLNVGLFKIPLHISYQYPNKSIFKPFISIGLLSPSYSAGVMFKINKKINIGIQGWTDFSRQDKVYLLPKTLLYSMTMANLYLKF